MKKIFFFFILLLIFSCRTKEIDVSNQLIQEACDCIIKNSEGITKKRFLKKVRKECIKRMIYQNSEKLKKDFNGKSVVYNYKYYEYIFTEQVNQNCPKTLPIE